MYRKSDGSRGFSFTRFAHIIVPNLHGEDIPHVMLGLHPLRRDMLYSHQLASLNPYALDERSIHVAGVVDTESMSKKIFKLLQRQVGLLDENGIIDTRRFEGRKFTHRMAVLNVNRQRELVDMLFWWEEECNRLRKLQEEEAELRVAIEGTEMEIATANSSTHHDDESPDSRTVDLGASEEERRQMLDELRFAREKVRMRIRQRPSERRRDVEEGQDDLQRESFVRMNRTYSSPLPSPATDLIARSATTSELPPAYYR